MSADQPDLPPHEPGLSSEGGWTLRLEVDEPGSRVVVAVDATGTIAGLATAGTSRDPDAPTILELYSINVVQHLQGRGLADALMDATVDRCDLTVWVVAENARARRFYDRHGFRVDAGTRLHEGTGASEMRMVRRFQAADR